MDKRLVHQMKRFFFVLCLIIIIYVLCKYVIIVFLPFIIAIFIAYLIDPIVSYIARVCKLPRFIVAVLVIFLITILIGIMIMFIITELIESTTLLADQVPLYFKSLIIIIEDFIQFKITPLYNRVITFFQDFNGAKDATISKNIHQLANQIIDSGSTLLRNILLKIPLFLSYIPQSIISVFFTLLATIFITNEWKNIKNIFNRLIPSSMSNSTRMILLNFKKKFVGYLKAQLILILIASIITFITLFIFNIEHAFTISLLIACVDILPLIGTGIIFIPWIIYLFLSHQYHLMLGISLLYLFIVLTRQLLEPKIVSAQIGLSPLTALLILFVSMKLLGSIIGIIVAPILLVLASSLHQTGTLSQLWNYIKG